MPAELGFSLSDSRKPVSEASIARAALTVAQWCARRGWPVHPLAHGRKTPAANCDDCRRPGHVAAGCACLPSGRWCHGFHAATLDQRRINRWWTANPLFGVGVACGPAGLVVIDIDAHQAEPPDRSRILPGIPSPRTWTSPVSPTDSTPSPFWRPCGELPAPRTTRAHCVSGPLPVGFTSGTGQETTVAGSAPALQRKPRPRLAGRRPGARWLHRGARHDDQRGNVRACREVRQPAVLPSWLAQELERTGTSPGPTSPLPVSPAPSPAGGTGGWWRPWYGGHVLAAVLAPVQACGQVAEGAGFTDALNRAAYTLGGLVAAGRLVQEDAERALVETAHSARPGQERRAEQIIRSGMAAGLKRPLHPGSCR
ncbi:bifunctional DNA primase/polymerase [Streptomyces sp. I6]|uniref:bifunctional DNA primase/polymerase n=1 Tax=Streptomyces sp. I6 TaxID=2483113 RepID=UPI0011CDC5AC